MRDGIFVLGPLHVVIDGSRIEVRRSLRGLLAALVAAGPSGLSNEYLADQLWPDVRPTSWQSAIRNRVAAVRKLVGPNTVRNERGRLSLSDAIWIDSWAIIDHSTLDDIDAVHEFSFLDGEPFDGLAFTDLLEAHASLVGTARQILIGMRLEQLSTQPSARARQALHSYQRRAVASSDRDRDNSLHTTGTAPTELAALEPSSDAAKRAALYHQAVLDEDWIVAFDLAMQGNPGDGPIGDQQRALIESVRQEALDSERQFTLVTTLSRHFYFMGHQDKALTWSAKARALAETEEDAMAARCNAAIVGDVDDERTPIPLPTSFFTTSEATETSLRSLQVAIVSTIERCSADRSTAAFETYLKLVALSPEPYRRWIGQYMTSMSSLLNGDLQDADAKSDRARRYGELFAIGNAERARNMQRANVTWITNLIKPQAASGPGQTALTMGQPDQAVEMMIGDPLTSEVERFLESLDLASKCMHTCAALVIAAPKIAKPALRRRARRRLVARSGMSTILGAGVSTLGPIDMAISLLSDTDQDRHRYLVRAIAVADDQRQRLWQVVCRLQLYELTHDPAMADQARILATTPYLRQLVELGCRSGSPITS